MNRFAIVAAMPLIALSLLACTEDPEAVDALGETPTDPQFTENNELIRPENYREWMYVTSGLGMSYGPETPEGEPPFTNVFVHPDAYGVFKETGTWPDKTIFALEIRAAESEGSINQHGHFQGDILAVEAAVKDEARFPERWAYFGFPFADGGPPDTAEAFPKDRCFDCHDKNAAVDNTFVQFYPDLFDIAAEHGTLEPDYPK